MIISTILAASLMFPTPVDIIVAEPGTPRLAEFGKEIHAGQWVRPQPKAGCWYLEATGVIQVATKSKKKIKRTLRPDVMVDVYSIIGNTGRPITKFTQYNEVITMTAKGFRWGSHIAYRSVITVNTAKCRNRTIQGVSVVSDWITFK